MRYEEGRKKAQQDINSGQLMHSPPVYSKWLSPLSTDTAHLYRDTTAFLYDITLSRPHLVHNRTERWILRLYESDLVPHRYTFVAKHHLPGEPSNIISPISRSPFPQALAAWKSFFLRCTGVEWDFRVWGRAVNPTSERGGETDQKLDRLRQLCYGDAYAKGGSNGGAGDALTFYQPGNCKPLDDIMHITRPTPGKPDSDSSSDVEGDDGDGNPVSQRKWQRSRQALSNGALPPLPPRDSPKPEVKPAKIEEGQESPHLTDIKPLQEQTDPKGMSELANNTRYFTYMLPDMVGSETDGEALGELNGIVEAYGPTLLGPVKRPGSGNRAVVVGGSTAWKD